MTRTSRAGKQAGKTVTIGPGALIGALATTLVVLVVLAWGVRAVRGVPDSPATPGGPTALAESTAPTAAGAVPEGLSAEGNPFMGSPSAPVQIVAYSDYMCPNCRQFATEVLPWLRESWIAQGFVRVEYRDFAIRGEPSVRAAEGAHCAGEQGKYWVFHDALFAKGPQGKEPFSAEALQTLAEDAGLDSGALAECLDSGRYRSQVETSTQAATSKGFEGTPTYEINGRVTAGAIPADRWNELFLAFQRDLGG